MIKKNLNKIISQVIGNKDIKKIVMCENMQEIFCIFSHIFICDKVNKITKTYIIFQ